MKHIKAVARWTWSAATGIAYFLAMIALIIAMSIGMFLGFLIAPFVVGYQAGGETVEHFIDRVATNAKARARK